MMKLILTVCVLLCLTAVVRADDMSNGWGKNYDWVSFEDAQIMAKEQGKPVMLVLHKSWCGACKRLKPQFAEDDQIAMAAKDFIMVNLSDHDHPRDKRFAPDGGYIPRILFLDSDFTVRDEIKNQFGNPNYKYFYTTPREISHSMDLAMDAHEAGWIAEKSQPVHDEL